MAHLVDPDEAYEERRDNEAGFNDWPQDTWRSMEKDPPELRKPVLVTVEGTVCIGRFCEFEDEDFSGIAFDGTCLSDGEPVSWFSDYIECWQPAPGYQPKENFRQKTERIISELSGMMGKKMYYGEMVGAPAPYCHCGPMCYENPEDYILEKAVDILQKMLDGEYVTEEPQKTADEMFRALGYIKVSGRMYHREGRLYHTYITCLKTATTKVLYRKNGEVVLQATAMENKEILAVARLIEEMEVEK